MEDSQEARTWWKQWIWVEKLIFPVSVTQKEQLSGVFIFEFNFDANLRHPSGSVLGNWIGCHFDKRLLDDLDPIIIDFHLGT